MSNVQYHSSIAPNFRVFLLSVIDQTCPRERRKEVYQGKPIGQQVQRMPWKLYRFRTFVDQGREILMAKFYVQSGSIRTILDSVDLDRAALWAVNEVMDHTLSLDCETMEGGQDSDAAKQGMESRFLAATIQISEVGFDRDDASVVDTLEVFRHWYELFQAVSVLSQKFGCK
jgi:hypothetical protein